MYLSISILMIDRQVEGFFSLPKMPFFHDSIVMTMGAISNVEPCHVITCCLRLIWPIQNDAQNLENDWNPGIWILLWESSVRASQWIPIWQGLDVFSLCFLVLLTKVASGLEGLIYNIIFSVSDDLHKMAVLHFKDVQSLTQQGMQILQDQRQRTTPHQTDKNSSQFSQRWLSHTQPSYL